MRCAQCDRVIDSDKDAVWIRGTAICPECAQKSREFQRAFLKGWAVFAVLGVMIPMLLFCALGGYFFFGIWLPGWNKVQEQNKGFEKEFRKDRR
jgi:hypothetical protein